MYPNLRLQLWRRKLRQNQLARMLEIDETILSRIMNGFRQPAPQMRKQIALLLESDEGWLFETEDESSGKFRTGKVTS
jgi:transcriptional regulator with XRE-family HTH domain